MQIPSKRYSLSAAIFLLLFVTSFSCRQTGNGDRTSDQRPNILFVISDDQSYPHASAYGTAWTPTPSFDRVAERGVLFTHAFVAAPQCSPSRAAILTGRNIWQLEEAGTHSSTFPRKLQVFTDVLAQEGYSVAYTGKPWSPGNWEITGWPHNPVGKEYNDIQFDSLPTQGLRKTNYAANFETFLDARDEAQPFFFWFGSQEPHRMYEYGSGRRLLGDLNPEIPGFLPAHDSVVNDLIDYAFEISWFDSQLGLMLSTLERRGLLDNTIVVVTADNGMAFPHAKANMYDYGIHVPLAICGPTIPGGRKSNDLVGLIDLAPTFLELTGATPLREIAGRSLTPILRGTRLDTDTTRAFVLSGRERHTHARPDNAGYPARAIRTKDFLYVRNFKPERWPIGDPPPAKNTVQVNSPGVNPVVQGFEDIDDSPSKRVMIARQEQEHGKFARSFGMRPGEELYDLRNDPACLNNLSADSEYSGIMEELRGTLMDELARQGDPRVTGNGDVFETYPRFGRMRAFPGFNKQGEYNTTRVKQQRDENQ